MKNRYEGLLILNVKGNDEGAKEVIERIEADFKKDGALVEQIQKMGHRHFTYAPGDLSSGFYVNFVFQAEPTFIHRMQTKLKLDEQVYRQHYLKLATTKAA